MSTRLKLAVACVAAGFALMTYSARAGSATYDFTTDPSLDPNIQFFSTLTAAGNATWLSTGGNPGGFLPMSYAGTYQNTHIIFPNLDPGKVVTAFTVEADLRVGNGSDRPADGFSISFARSYDPVIDQWTLGNPGRGYAGDLASGLCPACEDASLPETGTSSGIAVCFDTWAGNTLPDGADLEGILVRVDNVTLPGPTNARGFPMPTRYGACDDITSLQTGLRDTDFWTAAGDIYAPEAWDTLCWQHLRVELDSSGKVTVVWKGNKLLDAYQTSYFPTPGRLILGVRTGGSHEQTHVDNVVITTAAEILDNLPPTAPGNLRTTLIGARRVALQWDPSVDAPDPAMRVAYNVSRDGVLIKGALVDTNYTDAPGPVGDPSTQLAPGSTHTYTVKAVDLSANESAAATLSVTLGAEAAVPGYFTGQVYTNVTGVLLYEWWSLDPNFPNSPGKVGWWLSGLSWGDQTAFGNTFGDNLGFRFAGTLTAPKSGQYRFFIRSDDSSAFYLNTTAAIPDPSSSTAIAEETDCCDAFVEPGVANDDTTTFATSEPVTLAAGTKYGFLWLVKEGGGGDWGQVAWRMEGDTTAAGSLPAIGGMFVEPATGGATSDPAGASATITQDLVDLSVGANAHLNLAITATTASPWGYAAKYQWFKNGAPIMNANAANYYTDVLAAADAGAYKALVSVPGAFAYSREMTLAVTNDLTPPTLVDGSAHGSSDFLSVTLRFSEPAVAPSATTAGNYTISGGVTVSAATRVDLYTIRLTTSLQAGGTEYTITVNNVQDNAGNAIAPNSTIAFKSFVAPPQGYANYQQWNDASPVTDLTTFVDARIGYGAAPTAPIAPTTQGLVQGFEMPTAWEAGSNYGGRMQGTFIAPTSGDYVFFCTSDDNSWLMLSTDENPANKKKIAFEPSWNGSRDWLGTARRAAAPAMENRSDQWAATEWAGGNVISLQAGSRHYIEGVWKEGGGGDGFGATYRLSTEADSVVSGASRIAGAVLQGISPVDPWVGSPVITNQPVGAAVAKGGSATFNVAVGDGARPLSYQWQRMGPATSWVNIDGATGSSWTITGVDVPNVGGYRCRVTNPAGSVGSRVVLLTLVNSFVIEAEDFDYNGGQHMPAADVMPYTGFAYDGLSATYGVDYHNDNNDSITYRRGGDIAVAGHGASMDNVTGNVLSVDRGGWTMVNNYKIGWIGTGDWHNFTRPIPAGSYAAFAALSYGDTSATGLKAKLSKVTAGVGTTNQTLVDLGFFDQAGSGGWGQNNLVPMKDAGGATAVISIADPVTTLRMSHDSGDFDWFMLVPSEGVTPRPEITEIKVNVNGTISVTWTGGGVLEATESLTAPAWQTVAATSPATLTPPAGTKTLFGRVKQ